MTIPQEGGAAVVAIVRTGPWQAFMEECFSQMQAVSRVVTEPEFKNGQCSGATADLRLILIETRDDMDFFREAMTCIDAGFLQAGGPVIAVVQEAGPAQEDQLLMMGASKVVRSSQDMAELANLITADIEEFGRIKSIRKDIERRASAIGDILLGTFELRTRREAQNLATMLSLSAREPRSVAVGLSELIINGIEHGCLRIGHQEKGMLIEDGALTQEIHRRRAHPDFADRKVKVEFSRHADRLEFVITDPGEGFDYMSLAEEPTVDLKKHGRGILMARGCFDTLEYRGAGNIVRAVHKLTQED